MSPNKLAQSKDQATISRNQLERLRAREDKLKEILLVRDACLQ